MRSVLIPFLAIVVISASYGGSAATDGDQSAEWEALALPPETFSDVVPKAPGPYTGPRADAIPAGWNSWADDDVDQQCGPLSLVFLNPDLQHDADGWIHAQGSFFIQFQAVGEGAQDITRFSFSFGKSAKQVSENQELNCNENLPESQLGKGTGGAYLLFYRSDFNKDDGFFVPIETRNVPDGEYAAAVHAYTGNDLTGYTEVARAWAMAKVRNCPSDVSVPNTCPQDTDAGIVSMDQTKPWPMVLPGDGEQTNSDVDGLTIEVLEELGVGSSPEAKSQDALDKGRVKASINGEPIELEPWVPPARDRDLVPLNDDSGCPAGNVRSVCMREIYSNGFKWEGTIECDDIIKVDIEDRNGNKVTKQIHNCNTFGGASDAAFPIVTYKNTGSDSLTVKAGAEDAFKMRLENVGGGTAHVNLLLEYNETQMEVFWQQVQDEHEHAPGEEHEGETHVMIEGGKATTLDIVIKPKADAPKGVYPVRAGLEYHQSGVLKEDWRDLNVVVESSVEATNETETEEEETKVVKEKSPSVGVIVLLGSVLALVAAVRRRRA